ncbi:MAG: two component transcriptional regulator, AraC family [Anaerocolumna sp.]|jgi:YesN/AraC family two-component response regulator|nr:two component transcriptional regulator, AraC family [Anaerocolumna sp.]
MYQLIIIDDEEHVSNGISNIFPWENIGFTVVGIFNNGESALDFIKKNMVHVVMTDIRMPRLSGIDIAKRLLEDRPEIKVIFMSGYSDFEYMKSAILNSVSDYLLKPIKYEELLTCFQRVCEQLNKENNIHEPEQQDSYYAQIVNTALQYIDTHIKDASLDGLAIQIKMSPSYLSRLIKEKSGKNFSTYLLEARMKKAAVLLKSIDYKHYEIAFMMGYDNPKNFSRTFRQFYGMSPKEFRDQSTK